MLRAALALLTAPTLLAVVPGSAPDAAAGGPAAQIDRACAGDVDRALSSDPLAFARIYGHDAHGEWHPLDATTKMRIARDPDIYSEVAQAWRVENKVVLVQITAKSLDFWAGASYCFRRSGTLARVMESSSGTEVRDDESRYLDERGTVVASRSQFYWLAPNAIATISPDFKPSTPTLYLTVHDLPFLEVAAPGAPH